MMSRLFAALLCAVSFAGCQTLQSSALPTFSGGGDPMPDDAGVGGAQGTLSSFRVAGNNGEGPVVNGPGPGVLDGALPSDEVQPMDSQNQPAAADRLRVYSGSFQVSTTDVAASADQLIAIVNEKNGYLQSRTDALVDFRVPAQHFYAIVDRLGDCGTVVSRSIQTDDVTDEYQDLGLRLGVMEASRQRLVALMDQAANLDELLKLEERLAKLTAEIESLKGKLKKLSQDVSWSTIQVRFVARSVVGQRKASPFAWVNQLGTEQVLRGFHVDADTSSKGPLRGIIDGRPPMDAPDGFLVVASSRHELQAVSPDDARVWLREFPVDKDTAPDFWAKAIQTHLVDHLGYRLIDQSEVQGASRQTGHQLLFEAESEQGPMRYLLTILPKPAAVWSSSGRIQVIEFAATAELYAEYVDAVGAASPVAVAVQDPLSSRGSVLVSER